MSHISAQRAIIDNDYDNIIHNDIGSEIHSDIILYLDAHSLETFLWKCDDGFVLRKIINNITNNITNVEDIDYSEEAIREIYNLTYETAMFVGACRLLSVREDINTVSLENRISLDEVKIGEEHKKLDRKKFVKLFFINIADDAVENIIEEVMKYCFEKDKWYLMRGHDLSLLFVFYIFKYFDLNERYEGKWYVYPQITKDIVYGFEVLLYKNYSMERIKKEQIYITISEWEKNHLTTS